MNLGMVEIVSLAVLLAAGTLVVRAGWSRRERWEPTVWAQQMDLQLTPRNEGTVRSYMARTRFLRFGGALVGLFVPTVYEAYVGSPPPAPMDFGLFDALVGYLLGAVIAELTIARPKAEEPTASLIPRELNDYIPPMYVKALRISTLVALALVPLYRLLPSELDLTNLSDYPPEIVLLPTILLVGVGVELLQRYIVARPQPAVASDLVNADDAIRSASLHALSGAGIALEFLIISAQLINLAAVGSVVPLRWIFSVLAIICFGIAIGSWLHLTKPFHRGEWHARETTQS